MRVKNRAKLGRSLGRAEQLGRCMASAALLAVAVSLGGCDRLMDVTFPGRLLDQDLDDPRLAETLVHSAESEFECAFAAYLLATGLWTGDFLYSGNTRTPHQTALRAVSVETFNQGICTSINPPALFLPLQVARLQGDEAARRIDGFDSGSVADKNLLIARASAYAGYSYLLLGEAMCELTFDDSTLVTREQAWRTAQDRFTRALELAGGVTTGQADEARSIRNMALTGRARASLNLGDAASVVADAGEVDEGFVRYATMSAISSRRNNRIFTFNNEDLSMAVAPSYLDLEVDGVEDPRVQASWGGGATGFDGITDMWFQLKYPSRSSDIPFASWREAQLMIAEVDVGQAVDIINALRATHGLPEFNSTDPAEIEAQVREERRRELWLQGTRLGDMLRLDLPFPTGVDGLDHRRDFYGPFTCYPLPEQERQSNPNL